MSKRFERKQRREAKRRQRYIITGVVVMVVILAIAAIILATREPADGGAAASGDYETTASGLQYRIIEEGSGPKPQPGDTVRVHYTGTLEDGTVFDSSEGRDPIEFPLGMGAVIAGWDEGIALLNEGARAEFVIPPDLAYGPQGNPPVIPPNATLTFEVELVEILSSQ